MTVIIADAGPIIALSRIGQLDLLQNIFQQITITPIVRDEILDNQHNKGKASVVNAISDGWIIVKTVVLNGWKPINSGVDDGEASSIYLALQALGQSLLIIDDQAGRAEANYQKVTLIGTAAIIALAEIQGHISSARSTLNDLRKSGYYIGDAIIEAVLRDLTE